MRERDGHSRRGESPKAPSEESKILGTKDFQEFLRTYDKILKLNYQKKAEELKRDLSYEEKKEIILKTYNNYTKGIKKLLDLGEVPDETN